jgi:hypothetical protein
VTGKYHTGFWFGGPDGKRPLRRSRRSWDDDIKTNLQAVGWGMDWIDVANDKDKWWALVSVVKNLRVS